MQPSSRQQHLNTRISTLIKIPNLVTQIIKLFQYHFPAAFSLNRHSNSAKLTTGRNILPTRHCQSAVLTLPQDGALQLNDWNQQHLICRRLSLQMVDSFNFFYCRATLLCKIPNALILHTANYQGWTICIRLFLLSYF